MTTIAEFKKMLQQEINEPLDYPRVPGLSAEELREYNEGYASACGYVRRFEPIPPGGEVKDWQSAAIDFAADCADSYRNDESVWGRGKHAAYTWALAELKGLEGETECENCDGRKCMGCVMREWGHECADDCPTCCPDADAPDSVLVSRARYNYLLELERSVTEFTESFAKWEES